MTISYQGVLTDGAGAPVTDPALSMSFSIYDAETGGLMAWTETQTVSVQNGSYAVQLGAVNPLPISYIVYEPLWLEISVGGEVLAGRQHLTSVPYSLVAYTADMVQGYSAAQLDQSAHLTDTGNPHNVTAAQVGAADAAAFSSHTSDTGNPHGVTAAQTGAVAKSGDTMTGRLTINAATAGPVLSGSGGGLLVTGTGPVWNSVTNQYEPGVPSAIPASGAGTRMMWYPEKAAFRSGEATSTSWDDAKIGSYSFATGRDVEASGDFSLSMGVYNTVTGNNSMAVGGNNLVSTRGSYVIGNDNLIQDSAATYSTALGSRNEPLSDGTIAIGSDNKVGGAGSITIGRHLATTIYGVTALGHYNAYTATPISNIVSWLGTDPLFVIGNGTSDTNRSNALVMLKNGDTTLNGNLTATSFTGDGSGLTNLPGGAIADASVTAAKLDTAYVKTAGDTVSGNLVVNGQVGVGTSVVTGQKLSVHGGNDVAIYAESTSGWTLQANSYVADSVSVAALSSGGTAVRAETAGVGVAELGSTAHQAAGFFNDNVLVQGGSAGGATIAPSALLHVANTTLDNTPGKHTLYLTENNNAESSTAGLDPAMPYYGIGFRRAWNGSNLSNIKNIAGIYAYGVQGYRGGLVFKTENAVSSAEDPDVIAMVIRPDGNVGIGTNSPAGKLDVNGAIYQRGGSLHADYVFESDYQLESIENHEQFMWQNKHLKAIPKARKDEQGREIIEAGAHRRGMVEELEKAHIYISRLNRRIKEQAAKIAELEQEKQETLARLTRLEETTRQLAQLVSAEPATVAMVHP
ncbi:hypothetical protein C2E25_15815 [Geothermobacter hydrogeniphilus]|uniref:Peptidase S74 domain-containing protein n=1 Tax=Geothermobacter hydrogeniphilus TaxID=1969733 RepID=A0A2K2H6C7_9BACT|nr:hypothetical protein C2E25_15815 [Geothermobacter hydrogeniphilus]